MCTGCAMIKNIQKGETSERYETLLYGVVLLSEIGIVIAAVLRSVVFI
jgi:hypothetical protein